MPIVRNGQPLADPSGPATQRRPRSGSADGSTKGRGKAAASAASAQSQEVASAATDQGQRVAGVATRQAQEVKATVKEQATQLTQELTSQGRGLVQETKQQLQTQAHEQTQSLAQTLLRWGQETQALVEGRPEEAPTVRQYAQQAADKLTDVASEIEERGVEGLIDEVAQFARRRPGAFLLGAAVVGFGGGRLLRGASGDSDDSGEADMAPYAPVELASAPVGGRRAPQRRRQPVTAGTGGRNPASQGGE